MNTEALKNRQRLVDDYANAMQSGEHKLIESVLGVGQVASVQEAAENLGLELAIIGPFNQNRERIWAQLEHADVVLLDSVLDLKILPALTLVNLLKEGRFFEHKLSKPLTVFVRTSRPELLKAAFNG